GSGISGNTVQILNDDGDQVCETIVDSGEGSGNWFCDLSDSEYNFSQPVTSRQIDAGNSGNDGVIYTISIMGGGISVESGTFTPVPPSSTAPTMTYHFFPGGITVQSSPDPGYDSVFV